MLKYNKASYNVLKYFSSFLYNPCDKVCENKGWHKNVILVLQMKIILHLIFNVISYIFGGFLRPEDAEIGTEKGLVLLARLWQVYRMGPSPA